MALRAIAKADLDDKVKRNVEDFTGPLRQKLKEEVGLKFPDSDDFLLKFLRARDFKVDRAFELITNYYKVRMDREWFAASYPSAVKLCFDRRVVRVLKTRDLSGCRIVVVNVEFWDPSIMSPDDIGRALFAAFEELVRNPVVQEKGIAIICDYTGMNMSHIAQVKLKAVKMFAGMLRNSFPAKVKGFHSVNMPVIMETVIALLKTFLSEKIKSRLLVHSTMESLHEIFPPEILPKRFDGELPEEYANDNSVFEAMLAKDDEYKKYLKYGYGNREDDEDSGDEVSEL